MFYIFHISTNSCPWILGWSPCGPQEDVEGLAIFGAEWGRAGTELKADGGRCLAIKDGEVIKKIGVRLGKMRLNLGCFMVFQISLYSRYMLMNVNDAPQCIKQPVNGSSWDGGIDRSQSNLAIDHQRVAGNILLQSVTACPIPWVNRLRLHVV